MTSDAISDAMPTGSDKQEIELLSAPITWEVAVRIHATCLEHGTDRDAKHGAMQELLRLARQYDEAKKHIEHLLQKLNAYRKELDYLKQLGSTARARANEEKE